MNNNKTLKNALVVTTVASTIDQFCMNDIYILQKYCNVSVLTNFLVGNNTSKKRLEEFKKNLQKLNISVHQINFSRSPFSVNNFYAYKTIKNFIEKNPVNLIHCHTPVAAALIRFACRNKPQIKIIYTAHGFHFFLGAPLINWMLFYPVEKYLARYTDILITINKEDFTRAKRSLMAKNIKYIPGVGIDRQRFLGECDNKAIKRKELEIPEDAFLVISVGELNANKNHEVIIKAIAQLNDKDIYYIICGQGKLEQYLKNLIKNLNMEKQIKLLGYCHKIEDFYKISDIFAFPSKREGLGLSALEAMTTGLPIVTSNIHGILDYSINGVTGYNFYPTDVNGFSKAINKLKGEKNLRILMGNYNKNFTERFDSKYVRDKINKIYLYVLNHIG